MKALENKILSFSNWSQPWTFRAYILKSGTLTDAEINLFDEIWTRAGDSELWNKSDLTLCAKASEELIAKNYNLADTAIANIVRALSYQWK